MWIDGKRQTSRTAVSYHVTSPIAAYIGCAYRKRNCWKGDIAEILVYNRALPVREREAVERHLIEKYRLGARGR